MPLTKIDDRGLKTPIDLQSNEKIRLGNGNDLQIYHDGYNSIIGETGTGILYLGGNQIKLYGSSTNEIMLSATENGAVELYHDYSKKFETTVNGVTISGDAFVADNNKFLAGTSNDLQIYHDGTHSYLYNLTGELKNRAAVWKVVNAANSEKIIEATENGSVDLYYDNSKKFETTSSGATITGTCTATSFSGDGSNLTGVSSVGGSTGVDFDDGIRARFGDGNDLQIYHSGSESFIQDTGTGRLTISTNSLHLKNGANNEVMLAANEGGNVELWYANNKKLETTTDGVKITDNFLGVNVGGPSGTPASRNAFLGLGDNDTGIAQNGDGQLEAWANNQEIMNWDTGSITAYKTILPGLNNSHDLGTTSNRWRNIYTNDLNLSNEGSSNDVDGSWGDWTIQEGESDLFLKNNRSGKKYKFNLTEVL